MKHWVQSLALINQVYSPNAREVKTGRFYLYSFMLYVHMNVPWHICGGQKQFAAMNSLLPPYGSKIKLEGLDLPAGAFYLRAFTAELSHWSTHNSLLDTLKMNIWLTCFYTYARKAINPSITQDTVSPLVQSKGCLNKSKIKFQSSYRNTM